MRGIGPAAIAAALLVVAGLVAGTGAAAQDLSFPSLAPGAAAGTGVQAPCRAPGLVGTARCGVYRVHEDRGAAAGRTVDIAFVVLEATGPGERAPDPVVLLPGGPGQAFTGTAVVRSRAMPDLRRSRDVLLVDVRGVGRSGGLDCSIPPFEGGVRARFGTILPPHHVAACRDSLARRADLSRYTTDASVDDLDELREWLGYPRVNLSGGSYGTRVAQVWMRRHPGSVRTAVINGVAPIERPLYVKHARWLQETLDRVVDGCEADAACRAAHPGLAAELDGLLARLRRGPVEVEVGGQRVPFGAADLAYALRGLLYDRSDELPAMVSAAAGGDMAPLAEVYLQRAAWLTQPGGPAGYHLSALCAEDIAPLDDAAVERETAGTFMGAAFIDAYRTACRLWPHARLPASWWTPVESDVPTLVLSGELDPVTPPSGGDDVAEHLSRSVHVVVPGGGHGVGGACVQGLIDALVTTGSVEGLAGGCGGG